MPNLEKTALLGVTACFLALPLGCSTRTSETKRDAGPPDTSSEHDTDALDASPEQAADALDASPDLIVSGPIWTDQSRAIDVSCYGFYQGSKRIRATRDQLSATQMDMLAALTPTTPPGTCVVDGISCTVGVTAADGTVARYISDESGACGQTGPKIPLRNLSLFLETVPCLYGNQAFTTTLDGGVIPLVIVPEPRCFNGVATSPRPATRTLQVLDPTVPRHLELDACNDQGHTPSQVHPQLIAPDGQTVLSPGTTVTAPGTDGTCWVLDYTFPAAGNYALKIDLDQGFPSTDLYLRFY